MKKILLSFFAVLTMATSMRADEGMWIPMLINKNISEMQKMGFKLSAKDVYDINNSSLKDAIVHFGRGCTAEMISSEGLLITNHHCGYGNIASLSTVESNHLENGFWAKSKAEEIHAKGLKVRFLLRMEDVTDKMLNAKDKKCFLKKKKKSASLEAKAAAIEKKAAEGGKYIAQVKSFFNSNQYFLLVYEEFTDVRLVGTPPKSLGKYGGDTDNWMWPRHTADFAMFRVYADANNKPAKYSKTNVPYKPKHFLPVSIAGVKEGDYTMVMGYPGRTNRYATSYELDVAINEVNPSIVNVRDAKLSIMRKYMRQDPAVKLSLASKYASMANYWKYFIGQTEQLKRLKVIERKKREEDLYVTWARDNGYDGEVMKKFEKTNNEYRPYAKPVVYYREAFRGSDLVRMGLAAGAVQEVLESKKVNPKKLAKALDRLKEYRAGAMKTFIPNVEEETLAKTTEMMHKDLAGSPAAKFVGEALPAKYSNLNSSATFKAFAKDAMANSFLANDQSFERFLKNPTIDVLKNDIMVTYANSVYNAYKANIFKKYAAYSKDKAAHAKEFTAGSLKMNKGQLFYPDANSTMRLSYGSVGGYSPKDAVYYDYKTTMKGLLAKYVPGDEEFNLPKDFVALASKNDFGRYADKNGNLVINFISNNDITGGNSGSPVMNDKGELLGLAFDGNWEAMSGDIAFDKEYKRTIVVDSRYILWIIEKYGNAQNLINEMLIKK